jgi:crotonobetainyl-CoA:carnitine CoA-transferase CaiB-like acyl-CoA transferase
MRLPDELADPHLAARQSFRVMSHALLPQPVPANARIARFSSIADPPLRPAPASGEHTRVICRALLAMTDAEIDGLARNGVLQPPGDTAANRPAGVTQRTA